MTAGLLLMENVLTPLAKIFLSPFGLSAAISGTDAARPNSFNNFNEETKDMMKIVKPL